MRIAHITATFPPYWGGTGNVAYYNARELIRRGHEVSIFTPRSSNSVPFENIQGISVHRLNPIFHYGNACLLPGLWLINNFNVIHFHYPFFGGEFAALVAYRKRIPFVVTYHQDVHLYGIPGIVERLLRKTISRWTLNFARQVLFTSIDYYQSSYARNIIKLREGKVRELPNGVDITHFRPGSYDIILKNKFTSQSAEKIILLVARLDRAHFFKGIPIFLQALKRINEPVNAVIVGEGDLKGEYEKQANYLGLHDRVYFTGQVSINDLPNYYRMASLSVLPSTTMGEAFGLVLLESLACQTPIIASNLPGVRTVVSDGVDGFLVQPGNVDDLQEKLQLMLSLPEEKIKQMGIAGRLKVEEKYTWDRAARLLEEIYEQAIAANSMIN